MMMIVPSSTCVRNCFRAALDDCSNDGEQPQAVSTLHGLSAQVRAALRGDAESAYLKILSSSLLLTESQSSTSSSSGRL